MKARCISSAASILPKVFHKPTLGLSSDRQFALAVGKDYVVYAMTVFLGHFWYYVCDENYTYYPIWNPAPLFMLVDNRVSPHWRLGFHEGNNPGEVIPILAFKEWAEDPLFYDHLTDGQKEAVEVFVRYKTLMDAESGYEFMGVTH